VLANSDSNIIIETNCAYVLDSFKEGSSNRSEVCLIAKEFNYMKPLDRQVIISKVNRLCNKVAHSLCQLSRNVLCSGNGRLQPKPYYLINAHTFQEKK
jgi:hypothetical protein